EYQDQVAARPSSRLHRGAQPSSVLIAVESRNWRSISPCGVPSPCTSGSTSAPATPIRPPTTSTPPTRPPQPAPPAPPPPTPAARALARRRSAPGGGGVRGPLRGGVSRPGGPVGGAPGPLPRQQRLDRVGHDPAGVGVAAAVDVRKTGDRDRLVVCAGVAAGD